MHDQPVKLDPERLKEESKNVDLGSDLETAHGSMGDRAAVRPNSDDPVAHPTSGATAPAR